MEIGDSKRDRERCTAGDRRREGSARPTADSFGPDLDVDGFHRFFAHSVDLLCVVDADGYLECMNPAWTRVLGWPAEALRARTLVDFVHRADRARTLAELAKLATGSDTVAFEHRFLHRDGSYRNLEWNASREPQTARIYAMARDLSPLRHLESQVLRVVDRERERIGQDLHDGLCQTLSGIAALSTALSRREVTKAATIGAEAAEIAGLLSGAIAEAREIARGLAPIGLREIGLDGALSMLSDGARRQCEVSCNFRCACPGCRVSDEVKVQLFRIAQEAVRNAIVHGRAKRVDLDLSCGGDHGLLSIRDDGCGLPDNAGETQGLGLHTMAYRARQIGGSLALSRLNGRGTLVSCRFPMIETAGGGVPSGCEAGDD